MPKCEVKDFEGNHCPNPVKFLVELDNEMKVSLCEQCKLNYDQGKVVATVKGYIKL